MPLNNYGQPTPGVAGIPQSGTQAQPVTAPPPVQVRPPAAVQTLQSQLAQMQQSGMQPNLQTMQTILGMMGPGAPQSAPGLGQLMMPQNPGLAAPSPSTILSPQGFRS